MDKHKSGKVLRMEKKAGGIKQTQRKDSKDKLAYALGERSNN